MAILSTGKIFADGEQVTATKLNDAVNDATFDSSAVDGTSTQLLGGSIVVKDNGITTAKILDANVTTAKILDANVTTAKIADDSITTAKITDDSITTSKILDSNVTTDKIADANVTPEKLAFGIQAWCVFDPSTGGTFAPDEGNNITSITKIQNGEWTVNFSVTAPSVNYGAFASSASNIGGDFNAATGANPTTTTTAEITKVLSTGIGSGSTDKISFMAVW